MFDSKYEVESIEHLDFEPPCQYYKDYHVGDDPASWRIKMACMKCHKNLDILICNPCKLLLTKAPELRCKSCGFQGPTEQLIILLQCIR